VDAAHTGVEESSVRIVADEALGFHIRDRGCGCFGATVALGALPLAGENAHAALLLGSYSASVALQELIHAGIVGDQRGYVLLDAQPPNAGEVELQHRERVRT